MDYHDRPKSYYTIGISLTGEMFTDKSAIDEALTATTKETFATDISSQATTWNTHVVINSFHFWLPVCVTILAFAVFAIYEITTRCLRRKEAAKSDYAALPVAEGSPALRHQDPDRRTKKLSKASYENEIDKATTSRGS